MRDITKQWPYPKGLKKYIYNNTDFKTNKTLKRNRFVSCIEMVDGKPMKRVFGFLSKTSKRKYQDMMVKEVARYYNHDQYLGGVYCNYISGYKYSIFGQKDHFYKYNKHEWYFDDELITDLDQFLIDHNLKYTGWEQYRGGIGFTEYITTYLENPKIELLVKAKLDRWVKYLKYLDTSKKSIHEIFKINHECVSLLYEDTFGLEELFICRKTNTKDLNFLRTKVAAKYRIREMRKWRKWQENDNEIVLKILEQDKSIKYISDKNIHIHDYLDYLDDLHSIGAITDSKELYPKNFNKAHQQSSLKRKVAENKELIDGFIRAYKKHEKYIYENSKYSIMPVKEPKELYNESEKLGHCVRTYDKDVAEGNTEIFFIRRNKSKNKPFYTLELEKKQIIQVRGKDNKEANSEIEMFVEEWAKKFKLKVSYV